MPMTLTRLREIAGMDRRALAFRAEISQSHLCNIEEGRAKPSLDAASRLVDALRECAMQKLISEDIVFGPDVESPAA